MPRPSSATCSPSRSWTGSSQTVILTLRAPAATLFSAISSRWRASSRTAACLPVLDGTHELGQLVGAHAPADLLVDHDHGGLGAGAHAAADLEGDGAVPGGLPGGHAQHLLGFFD